MKITHAIAPITLDMPAIVNAELPFASVFYHDGNELHSDAAELFEYMTKHNGALPIYRVDALAADTIMGQALDLHHYMRLGLDKLLAESNDTIKHWMAGTTSKLPGFEAFIEYARATRALGHMNLYGRMDFAVNPESGLATGLYELNADTPVMLFESVNLQNHIVTAMGKSDQQANDWWEHAVESLLRFAGKTVAVVCDPNFIEDTVSTDTMAQAFEAAGATAYFTSIEGFNHDLLSLEKPFFVDGANDPVDAVFMLLPWEEMIETGQEILVHWQKWHRNVQFFEPAWRWFMSHKGFLAYMTNLMETDPAFSRLRVLPLIPTYLYQEGNVGSEALQLTGNYVTKPVTGRLSHNIEVVLNGQVQQCTEGSYPQESRVIQPYRAPGQINGANFIGGVWFTGNGAVTLCFREFDSHILDIGNERFKAHVLV